MIRFNVSYFLISICIFIIEILIEKTSGFVRFTIGDFFAVIFVYAVLKSFFNISVFKSGLVALGIAFGIELLQLTNLQNHYPSGYRKIFGLILGSAFSFGDMLAYTLGIASTVFVEYRIYLFKNSPSNG